MAAKETTNMAAVALFEDTLVNLNKTENVYCTNSQKKMQLVSQSVVG